MMRWLAAATAGLLALPALALFGAVSSSMECAPASGVPVAHDGDVLATIVAVADALSMTDRLLLSAVQAALVESNMSNLHHGHLDSLGVFQQRPSQGWGTPQQVTDPAYAATAFFVGSTAAGSLAGGGNPGAVQVARTMRDATPGEIAQAVQRSDFPFRYDQREADALALLTGIQRDVQAGGGDQITDVTVLAPEACVDGVPPAVVDGMACPLPGSTFTDTWHAPRSGGRLHKGTDLMAPHGAPVYASHAGTVRLGSGGLGGRSVSIVAPLSGDRSYAAHLSGWVPGLTSGDTVVAGQPVGFNGSSGNATFDAPHVHFQWHPGGGAPVNPYLMLRELCSEPQPAPSPSVLQTSGRG